VSKSDRLGAEDEDAKFLQLAKQFLNNEEFNSIALILLR
jgi:hypothetical protein